LEGKERKRRMGTGKGGNGRAIPPPVNENAVYGADMQSVVVRLDWIGLSRV